MHACVRACVCVCVRVCVRVCFQGKTFENITEIVNLLLIAVLNRVTTIEKTSTLWVSSQRLSALPLPLPLALSLSLSLACYEMQRMADVS